MNRWLAALALLALVVAMLAAWVDADADGGFLPYDKGEFHVYTLAARRMVAGEEIYRPEDVKPFTYPPLMAVPFVPMLWLPDTAHRPLWYCANFWMLLWIFAVLRRVLQRAPRELGAGRRAALGFWVVVAVLAGRHVWAVFGNQSNDMFVVLCLTLAASAASRQRELSAGACAGIGAALKATPLLALPVFVWQWRRRAALGLALGAAAVLLPDLLFPRADGHLWSVVWYRMFVSGVGLASGNVERIGHAWGAWNMLNQSLPGLVCRLVTPVPVPEPNAFDVSLVAVGETGRNLISLVARVSVFAAILWSTWAGRARGIGERELGWRRFGEFAAIACGMVLLSPMSSKSHFVVLLLPIVFCCHELFFRRRSRLVAGCLGVLLLAAVTSKGIVGRELGRQLLARGSVTFCALAMLVATAAVLVRGRAGDDADSGRFRRSGGSARPGGFQTLRSPRGSTPDPRRS